MARIRRFRRYRKRASWSTRLTNIEGQQLATAGNDYIVYYNLAQNAAQDDNTVSQKYTVKNVHAQLQLEANNAVLVENLQAYIMFVPQGYVPTGTPSAYGSLPFDHPEWIMAYRFYGSAQHDNNGPDATEIPTFPPLRLRSRLSRKLDTGDRIVLIILGRNMSQGTSVTLTYRGLVKMNTKAN